MPVDIILTHENADFDAIASMLAAYKLNDHAWPVLPKRQHRRVREFLALYRNGLPFIDWRDAKPDAVRHITLTDTQALPSIRGAKPDTPVTIIEHHPQERPMRPHEAWQGEDIGAVTTVLVERLRARKIALTSLEATLMALGIYTDTGMLTYGGTTPRDALAVAWLLEQGAVLDTIRRFTSLPLNPQQQDLLEVLLDNTETRSLQGYEVTIATADFDAEIQLNTVAQQLSNVLNTVAVCVLVQLPRSLNLICRSADDAVDVGAIAQLFGGGGHPRAAAATIRDQTADDVKQRIWAHLTEHVQPAVRISDLMSYGVRTVQADERITDIITHLRRIGHEGFPVLDAAHDDALVGLLTLRDADRTLEHGLKRATVREVMRAGAVSVSPDDAVSALEQAMVRSGWGQIPVVQNGKLIGIVTRTDLITHWARTHPSVDVAEPPNLQRETTVNVLGEASAALIDLVAQHAQQQGITLYLVGGVVRDLLLTRPNFDIDFVVEGDAIQFAQALIQRYGGGEHSYRPFGTAKWQLAGAALGLDMAQLPQHIDFASARNEFYEHPTALPTVYNSSIKLDLGRRDFTINTLAVQLSPSGAQGRVLDFYGGLTDLDERLIRVLHSLSFVDDPTRILRAVRFSERLQFSIEARTNELIQSALPMLRRITGERLRNELTLLLREQYAARGMLKLQASGVLASIHPAFRADERIRDYFQRADAQAAEPDFYWHLLLAHHTPDEVAAIGERLLFSQRKIDAMQDTARLVAQAADLTQAKPSEVVRQLDQLDEAAFAPAQIIVHNPTFTQQVQRYQTHWRELQPITNGHTLREMGLTPGPQYRVILEALRDAWLDEHIQNAEDERALLQTLIAKVYGDDST